MTFTVGTVSGLELWTLNLVRLDHQMFALIVVLHRLLFLQEGGIAKLKYPDFIVNFNIQFVKSNLSLVKCQQTLCRNVASCHCLMLAKFE